MKGSATIMSTYTADVSGVCSALYELGGMVVIHDPSGCNSTYNTHDELRWYDQDSLIFISGMSEIDAILGGDDKLIHDVVEAARQLSPAFIALCGSPIPMMSGVDFDALARIIEKQTGIPTFGLATNGMHSYIQGVGMALKAIAERFVKAELKKVPKGVNVLGVTPLDFACGETIPSVQQFLATAGYQVISCWAQGSNLAELSCAGQAEVNLVVSSAGFTVAEYLWERFGIPYVVGLPVQGLWSNILTALEQARTTKENQMPFLQRLRNPKAKTILVGEAVTMSSLAAALEKTGKAVQVLCTLETPEELAGLYDKFAQREVEIMDILQTAQEVWADPLYKYLVPPAVKFRSIPHVAFSGRIYVGQVEDWTKMRL